MPAELEPSLADCTLSESQGQPENRNARRPQLHPTSKRSSIAQPGPRSQPQHQPAPRSQSQSQPQTHSSPLESSEAADQLPIEARHLPEPHKLVAGRAARRQLQGIKEVSGPKSRNPEPPVAPERSPALAVVPALGPDDAHEATESGLQSERRISAIRFAEPELETLGCTMVRKHTWSLRRARQSLADASLQWSGGCMPKWAQPEEPFSPDLDTNMDANAAGDSSPPMDLETEVPASTILCCSGCALPPNTNPTVETMEPP